MTRMYALLKMNLTWVADKFDVSESPGLGCGLEVPGMIKLNRSRHTVKITWKEIAK